MRALILSAALLAASTAAASERHEVPEGWWQLEDGYGESANGEMWIEVEPAAARTTPQPNPPPPATPPEPQPPAQPPPQAQPPSLRDEIEAFQRVDCDYARGRYLARVLELHGVEPFWTDPRELLPLTTERPPAGSVFPFGGALGDPALAVLYGEPPVPPGALSYDFELQDLARQLLTCMAPVPQGAAPPPPPPGAAPNAAPPDGAPSRR